MLQNSFNPRDHFFHQVVLSSPLTVSPELSVNKTIDQMHQAKSSYVLVVEQQRPVGIFTERDLVRVMAAGQPVDDLMISAVMTANPDTIAAHEVKTAVDVFARMQRARVCYLSVVGEDGQLVGIVTQSSVLQALNSGQARQVIDLLQQEVIQLRFENQALLAAHHPELVRSQTKLSDQLENKPTAQQQTQNSLAAAYHELKLSYGRLVETNEALTVALQALRSLLENVYLVVIGLDCDGKINYANPFFLRLTGYSADEVLGKDWCETFILHQDYYPTYQYFQRLIAGEEVPMRYRHAVLTHAGTARIIDWNNAVLRDHQNAVIGILSIGEDITEQLEVDRIKGEFISAISHELRTPLTAIHGSLELLTRNLVSSESQQGKQLLQLAADNDQRLVRLVNDILDLERLESGKALLNKQQIDTRLLTHKVVDTLQVTAKEKGITLSVSDPGLFIMADGDRLMQVLTNLLDNAIKFSKEDSAVWLSVEQKDKPANNTVAEALFKVRDQGRGISAEHLVQIFDRFTQINRSDSWNKGGTGLGLSICKNIVEQHNGSIWVESQPGEGSCFQFTVPCA